MVDFMHADKKRGPSMLAKGKWTILVMPSSPHKRAFSISVPVVLLTGVFFVFCILLYTASAGAWRMYRFQQVEEKTHRLEMENRSAKSQIQNQKSQIEELTREILVIREKAGYVQDYLGLKPKGTSTGKIGQGGVEITLQSAVLSPKSPSVEFRQPARVPSAHEASLALGDIHQLKADLQQIVGALQERKEKLDRTPFLSPVDPQTTWISSSYGMRISPFTGKEQLHPGLDIAGAEGTAIIAPAKGTVAFVGKNGPLGMSVQIRHDSVYETTYGHLNKAIVKKGQPVERGEVIGYLGNSGRSTGHHLHYEIAKNGKTVNPLQYMLDWRNETLAMLAE